MSQIEHFVAPWIDLFIDTNERGRDVAIIPPPVCIFVARRLSSKKQGNNMVPDAMGKCCRISRDHFRMTKFVSCVMPLVYHSLEVGRRK